MPTCTQITDALEVLAEAAGNPNTLTDLSGQVSSIFGNELTETTFQLTSGGDAVLTIPSGVVVDGRRFQLLVGGVITMVESNPRPVLDLRVYNQSSLIFDINSVYVSSNVLNVPFSVVLDLFWDSTTQNLLAGPEGSQLVNSSTAAFSVSSSSDIQVKLTSQFGLNGGLSSVSPSDGVLLTQFKLQLV